MDGAPAGRGRRDTSPGRTGPAGIPSGGVPRFLRLRYVIPAILLALVAARIVYHYAAEITVKSAFFDALGMGGAYDLRWRANVLLGAIGLILAVGLAIPVLLMRWERAKDRPAPGSAPPIEGIDWEDWPGLGRASHAARRLDRRVLRLGVLGAFVVTTLILIAILVPGLIAARDELLSAARARDFGVTDPVFGNDIAFFVFVEPALNTVFGLAAGALGVAAGAAIVTGVAVWFVERGSGSWAQADAVLGRARTAGFLLGGLFLASLGALLWTSRYGLVIGDGDVVAGAGAATRDIDIPTRAIGAVAIWVMAAGILALAIPAVRRRASRISLRHTAQGVVVAWAVLALALAIIASPWWLVLLLPIGLAGGLAWGAREGWGLRPTPLLALPVVALATAAIVAAIGPVGAALNDAIVLRGSPLQVERENIAATLESTRRATGLDQAETRSADYRPNGVTAAAIAAAPASVGSLRFLDIPPTAEACSRQQTLNQFYQCQDVDIDRYVIGGERRTVFTIGREIDYSQITDFQRRHFTFTNGYGLIAAPVNEITQTGRPVWVAGSIPQKGLEIERPEIYFGAQPGMPWAVVNTDQPVFVGQEDERRVRWTGQTGVPVGSGWDRLAMTEFLGGLPYVGGGRRFWNATGGQPADAASEVLLYRDIRARVAEIAPFLAVDNDPYFAEADGRLWVLAPVYTATDRYPYAARFGNVRYVRQPVMAAMDAYSGETHLYVLDDQEPMLRTWRAVYPELFTDLDQMPESLRTHLRYGEDVFDFQSAALGRFHVDDPDTFFNGDEAWTITQEAYGPGVQGDRIVSPARYTYAVLPGQTQERFVAVRNYKPRTTGRGIGFSGWLAASNEPEDFGKLLVLEFPINSEQPLDSLDTFTSNVARDPQLSEEIGLRRDQVLRGNTIVVPIGEGLLYVQPLYLDAIGDSLPTLWQVIVSFGDQRVFAAPTFERALARALGAPGDGGDARTPPTEGDLATVVQRAAEEFEAYRQAFGRGDDAEAAVHLRAFQRALNQARALAEQQQAGTSAAAGPAAAAPDGSEPGTTTGSSGP